MCRADTFDDTGRETYLEQLGDSVWRGKLYCRHSDAGHDGDHVL